MIPLPSLEPLEDRLLLSVYSKSDDDKYVKRALDVLEKSRIIKPSSQPARGASVALASSSLPRSGTPPASLPELKITPPVPSLPLESAMILWDVNIVTPSTGDVLADAYNLSRGASGIDPKTKRIALARFKAFPVLKRLDMKDPPPLPTEKEEEMILDFSNPSLLEGITIYPDWAFVSEPKQSSDIKENVTIQGTSTGGSASVTGTADQQE